MTLLPCYDDFNAIGAGFGFPVRFKVEASDDPEFKTGVALLWRHHDATFMADFENPGLAPFTTGGAKDDGIAGRYVRVTATKLAPRKDDFIFALAELQVTDASGKNVAQGKPVTALDSIEAPPRWRKANLTDGIAPVAQSPGEKEKLVQEREALLISFADDATKAKRAALLAESQRIAGELKKLPAPNAVYAGGIHTGSGSFAGTGATGGKPRPIFFLARGEVTQPGREVAAGTLSALTFTPARFSLAPDAPEGERRAALAHWITDPRNPLTWRSIVNRVWQYHFGRGLVETPNDFGRNGALPVASRTARLARRRVPRRRRIAQDAAPADRDERDLPAGRRRRNRRARRARSTPATRCSGGRIAASSKPKPCATPCSPSAASSTSPMGGPGLQDFVIEHPEHSPHYEYGLANPEDPEDVAALDLPLHRALADAAVDDLARLRRPVDPRGQAQRKPLRPASPRAAEQRLHAHAVAATSPSACSAKRPTSPHKSSAPTISPSAARRLPRSATGSPPLQRRTACRTSAACC